jgi:DNA-binding PadR family transcriptional regulator
MASKSDRPIHGYVIVQRLQQLSRYVVPVPQGSLYPARAQLEAVSLILRLSEGGAE